MLVVCGVAVMLPTGHIVSFSWLVTMVTPNTKIVLPVLAAFIGSMADVVSMCPVIRHDLGRPDVCRCTIFHAPPVRSSTAVPRPSTSISLSCVRACSS